jgi:crotonobetainyl-CoA:carnitine CoA-transferase CaiB-like acyl-CoA transferase
MSRTGRRFGRLSMTSSLDGITVIDLTRGAAGAIATMFLADHGARVVRVVDEGAAVLRDGGFRVWDRGKTVTCAAFGQPGHQLESLIAAADVLVEDHVPGQRPKDLLFEALATRNPRLIVCSITPYGEDGPWRDEPPVDDLVLARAGVLAGLPGFRQAPVHLIHPLPSTGAGLLATLGIAAALFEREKIGTGRRVTTSLLAGALIYHPKVVAQHLQPNKFQTNPYGSAPFYSVYECADGAWVQLGCVHTGFIARAAELMGIAGMLDDPVFGKGHAPQTDDADAELRQAIARVMARRPYADWEADFEARDIPYARSRTTDESLEDAQVHHNEMVVALPDPEVGRLEQMGVPIKMGATPGKARAPRTAAPVDAAQLVTELASCDDKVGPVASRPGKTANLPLRGVRVLEITNLIAGPMAGRLLADLGADVIKLEPPQGDISRPIGRTYFFSVNFAKRSVCVDTARPEGKAIAARLASSCDAVLANLRPGATERMGIGTAFVPSLIEAQISGYGLSGPYAHRPGIDPLAQALMGLERAQGGEGNPPSFPAQLAPTDFTTGTMAAIGIVLALFVRARGAAAGQRIEVNLLDGGIMLSSEWFTRFTGRPERPLADRAQLGTGPFHRLYELSDGFVYVAADAAAERERLNAALTLADPTAAAHLKTAAGSTSPQHPNEGVLPTAFTEWFRSLDKAKAAAILGEARVPFAPVEAPDAAVFFETSHAAANGFSTNAHHPNAGQMTVVQRYVGFGASARDETPPTPLLGEHSAQVLREAGFSKTEIDALFADGLVKSERAG